MKITKSAETYDACGRGICAAQSGHEGTCGQASGWASLVYLAGPMSGLPEYNYPAFNAAADVLRSQGYIVLNPTDIEKENKTGKPQAWEWYMRRALDMVLVANGVALLPGWENSRGASLEERVARSIGIDVRPLDVWAETREGDTLPTEGPAMTDTQERDRIISNLRAEWDRDSKAHGMVLSALEIDTLLAATERPEDVAEVQVTDVMVEGMARMLFAQSTEARSGFRWPVNGDWGRTRDLERARSALAYVLSFRARCPKCEVTVTDQTPSSFYPAHDERCGWPLEEPTS